MLTQSERLFGDIMLYPIMLSYASDVIKSINCR